MKKEKKFVINLDITIKAKNQDKATALLSELLNNKYKYYFGEIKEETNTLPKIKKFKI